MADISKLNGYELKDAKSRTDIAGIKDGTIKAKNAEYAEYADGAGTADMAIKAERYTLSSGGEPVYIEDKFDAVTTLINNVANGVNRGYAFNSIDELIGHLQGQANNTNYKIGDELYIKAADKPDYWVAEVTTTKGAAVTQIADGTTVGYWVLYKLGEKTDLSEYATKSSLNAVKVVAEYAESRASGAEEAASTNRMDISAITTGDLHVGYAEHAEEAAKAEQDGRSQNIAETYIKNLSVAGKVITYTKGNGTTGTITTQDTTYTLPVATTTVRGGMKVGAVRSTAVTTEAASSTASRYYAVERDSNEKLFVNVPWANTTYSPATASVAGLMSSADKTKLDRIKISVSGEEMTITV